MRRAIAVAAAVLCCAALVLLLLARGGRKPEAKRANPAWRSVIAGHTTGLIPRRSKIFVQFKSDIFKPDEAGRDAGSILRVEPSISGTLAVAGPREVLLVPKDDLKQGAYYLARVKGGGAPGLPAGIGDYEFVFQVMAQDFSYSVEGLVPGEAGPEEWVLKGSVSTADFEESQKVERVLTASLEGRPAAVAWTHDGASNTHAFIVSGIRREKSARTLRLALDGAAIGVSRSESRDIEVPAQGVFKVVEARPVQGAEQYVAVYFSDALDPRQNLKGLARLTGAKFNAAVEGNVLKLLPQARVAGKVTVVVEPGLQNSAGATLRDRFEAVISFASQKPQVRFAGSGVILPDNDVLSIPIEALNVHSVQVTAFKIYESNVGQFLQTNKLNEDNELNRVGRFLWRKTILLPTVMADQWQRYSLDAGDLLRNGRGGLYRLSLSINRGNSAYACSETESAVPARPEDPITNHEDLREAEASGWDAIESGYEESEGGSWKDRDNPCEDGYYRFAPGARASRNFLASNIGLVAKRDQKGRVLAAATDIRTAEPMAGVRLSLRNFQGQPIAEASTDGDGFAALEPQGKPFYLAAQKGDDRAYLKLSDGTSLPVSHFDVDGERVQEGLKGFIYGERGVWRPGDEIHLVFVLEDKDGAVPEGHPASLRLFNPKGQLVETRTNNQPVGGFYRFTLRTAEDAPTGAWSARVQVGGSEFSKDVRVETIMPNRLKAELDFGRPELMASEMPARGRVFSQWLHGASAAGLKADVAVRLSAAPTRLGRFGDHVFDDPAREAKGEEETVFDGTLDGEGRAAFDLELQGGKEAPGMLSAQFKVRVFEEGGAFSTARMSLPYHPYPRYVGIKLPQGDQARNMLMTDTAHPVSLVSLDPRGKPVAARNIQVTLYKLEWKWWWDRSGESLAKYASASHSSVVRQEKASAADGQGQWRFEVKYPEWGRFLLRACDLDGGHCAGKVFYIDWPGWAGRAQEQGGAGASVLLFSSDKPEYAVGETAVIRLPEAAQGRALLTVENGSRILERRWVAVSAGRTSVELPVTREMSPNVYVSVTLLQPHKDKKSDRPIRLYGVLPLAVKDQDTVLAPVLQAADEWKPESSVSVTVSEAKGRAMAYTLAVVDEGLLGLTAFQTPDPHSHFYRKEALGVATWDIFDDVVGAYGGELERLLALGGGEDLDAAEQDEKRRFPPVVRFLGPFKLGAKASQEHKLELPPYVGSVRVMAVAGGRGAYGRAEKSVFVRQPMMLLATLPRLVGPEEELTVPVSVFVMKDGIKDVSLTLRTDSFFAAAGPTNASLRFARPGDQLGFFKVRSGPRLGVGRLTISAASGPHAASAQTALAVRAPNPAVVRQVAGTVEPGAAWERRVEPHGLPDTNEVSLEVSAVPPLGLERRLGALIRYPHGCVEQVTSSVFPQLYLPDLVGLTDGQRAELEKNIRAGIERLRSFQAPSGGFMYWPGGGGEVQEWATNYAGHFLMEAQKRGYPVAPEVRSQWLLYQKTRAQAWSRTGTESVMGQAYRLYTLALAGDSELGSMNRLREAGGLDSVSRWLLACAYGFAGIKDAAEELVRTAGLAAGVYSAPGPTFGSDLRDKAVILHGLTLGRDFGRGKALADEISSVLASDAWHDTHGLAFALMSLARFYGEGPAGGRFAFDYSVGAGQPSAVRSDKPVARLALAGFPAAGGSVKVRNPGDKRLYAVVAVRGVPKAGEEEASSAGLGLAVDYLDGRGSAVDVSSLGQGAQVTARVSVKNLTSQKLDYVALTHMAPSGWEIDNPRWGPGREAGAPGLDYQDVRDDRIYTYFGLGPREEKTVSVKFTAAYPGRFYMPALYAEAMYDAAARHAAARGRWVTVERR